MDLVQYEYIYMHMSTATQVQLHILLEGEQQLAVRLRGAGVSPPLSVSLYHTHAICTEGTYIGIGMFSYTPVASLAHTAIAAEPECGDCEVE